MFSRNAHTRSRNIYITFLPASPSLQMKMGFLMNVCCVLVHLAAVHTIGALVFDLNNFPSWADRDFGMGPDANVTAQNVSCPETVT